MNWTLKWDPENMELGRFRVAMAPFGLRFGPAGAKWVQDLKKPSFGVPGVAWGSNRAIFGFRGQFPIPGVGGMGAALSIRRLIP